MANLAQTHPNITVDKSTSLITEGKDPPKANLLYPIEWHANPSTYTMFRITKEMISYSTEKYESFRLTHNRHINSITGDRKLPIFSQTIRMV